MRTDHLSALELRLSHERVHLAAAKSENERKLRSVWITQIEKEISDEKNFLGIKEPENPENLSDEELLAYLCTNE